MDAHFPTKSSWLDRTSGSLHRETVAFFLLVTGAVIFTNIGQLAAQFRARRQLKQLSADRPAIISLHNAQMHRYTIRIFKLATLFMLHALVIFCIDAALCLTIVADAAGDDSPSSRSFLSDFLLTLCWVFPLLTMTLLVAPLLQLALVSYLLARARRAAHASATTLAPYIPEARVLSTQMAYAWALLCFAVVAWWPVASINEAGDDENDERNALLRSCLVQVCYGSAYAWLDASFSFNFRAECLGDIDVRHWPGVGGVVRLFARKVVAVHSFSAKKSYSDVLPGYEEIPAPPAGEV